MASAARSASSSNAVLDRYQKWNANLTAGFFAKYWKLSDDLGVIHDVDD